MYNLVHVSQVIKGYPWRPEGCPGLAGGQQQLRMRCVGKPCNSMAEPSEGAHFVGEHITGIICMNWNSFQKLPKWSISIGSI